MLLWDWAGSCTLGIIRPSFFLLPRNYSQELGVPLYDELGCKKRELIGGTQKWADDEWLPEQIIKVHGPATWAKDGTWGYRTPIYMLNRIVRLQAVLEIITNQTALALDLITAQQKQMRTAIYQNRLALDYLLAEEGGICRKFNLSTCCVEIDDNREAFKNIANNIRKLAHVPVQWWTPLFKTGWWDGLLSGEWWKKLMVFGLCAFTSIIFLPCLLPCLIQRVTKIAQNSLEKLTDKKLMMLRTEKKEVAQETTKEMYEKYRNLRKLYGDYKGQGV